MAKHPHQQKRHKDAIRRDRALVAQLYLTGSTQAGISRSMNSRATIEYPYTPKMVEKDLEALRKQWLTSSIRDFDAGRAEELAKVNALEREAFDAWRLSQLGKTATTRKSTHGGMHGILTEDQERTETSAGDPRFLAVVQWCINKRCELCGYDAPLALDLTSGGKPVVFTLDLGENKPIDVQGEVIEPQPEVGILQGEYPVLPAGDMGDDEDLLDEVG